MAGHAYDVIVIGGGSTGENVADRVVAGGMSAVIVEAERVGGDCSYWACTPRGMNVRAIDYNIGQVAGASLYADGYSGRARMVVDQARGVIVGVTFSEIWLRLLETLGR